MSVTGTSVFPALARARFDPRLVVVGFLLLAGGTVSGYAMAGVAVDRADEIAAPVAALCQDGGQAGAQLADRGACSAAEQTSVGPFRSEVGATGATGAAGDDGAPGTDGQDGGPGPTGPAGTAGAPGINGVAGVAGQPGQPGNAGAPGTAGVDGEQGPPGKPGEPGTPGAPGRDGQDGAAGPPGPACPDGTTLQSVMFASGERGLGCVTSDPTPEDG